MKAPTITIELPDGEFEEKPLPWVWAICHACQGHGTTSAHLGSWTQSEWEEESYEFREDYLAGAYDISCPICDGTGKVKVVDEFSCDPEDLKKHRDQLEDEAYYAAEQRAEMRHIYGEY